MEGPPESLISGAAPIDTAQSHELTFLANSKYERHLPTTSAGAVVLSPNIDRCGKAALRHAEPYYTFARALDILFPVAPRSNGIHATAIVDPDASIDPSASIGPYTVIGPHVTIAAEVSIGSGVSIGASTSIGAGTVIHPRVVIADDTVIGERCHIYAGAVIGSDGFGYAPSATGLYKIQQLGNVVLEDDVEIGANSAVDRGALGSTRIGRGTKIDNLVQIAHNVEIGQHSVIVSQVGIAGSTKVGSGVVMAGQVGLVGHIDIGDGVTIGAQSGVPNSIPAGETHFGYPARPAMQQKRIEAAQTRLPELLKRVRRLEDELAKREKKHDD